MRYHFTCPQCGTQMVIRTLGTHHFCGLDYPTSDYHTERINGRFWKCVNKLDGCWEWTGSPDSAGYGMFSLYGVHYKAHRMSWFLHHGPIPDELCVLHTCDNPCCVRPDHLFLGTMGDNNRDKVSKNRQARGDRNGARTKPEALRRGERSAAAKLNDATVIAVRERYVSGETNMAALGRDYGVTGSAIKSIVSGRGWRHLLPRE
jgi:hypothetical protein